MTIKGIFTFATAGWLAQPALADLQPGQGYGTGYGGMGMGGMGMGYGGGWFTGPLMMLLVFLALVIAVVLVLRLTGTGNGPADRGGPAALDILQARFARGEIDEDEYKRRKTALKG